VRGWFVTGTDTGAGKTVVAAALVAALNAAGLRTTAFKPVVTGLDEAVGAEPAVTGLEDAGGGWPPDHELLAAAAGIAAYAVTPLRFGPAVSPHLAAQLAGTAIEPPALVVAARAAAAGADAIVVEGVGGLLVPFTLGYGVRDFARELALPVLVAARPGLGTINHSLLTVEAARAVGLDVRAVVVTPWPAQPSVMERSNVEAITRLAQVEVLTLAPVQRPEPEALAAAGAQLASILSA
jgi:dethiobiotin synthetase